VEEQQKNHCDNSCEMKKKSFIQPTKYNGYT
jgi:hypothetical protein